jgi:Acetyltransferase (GNAT) domain
VHGTIESTLEVEWRPLAELASIASDWRALAARALVPNVFYEPAFALAAQPVFGRDVGATLVWSRGATRRLLGLFPSRTERYRYGLPWSIVDREAAETVLGSWLEHIANHQPRLLLLPMFPQDGVLANAFDAALARRGGASIAFAAHERALLSPAGGRADYIERALPHKKLKELGRQLRRLGDDGAVAWNTARDRAAIETALADFLALEEAGWKGRAGTAAARNPSLRAFLEAAVAALAHEGKAEIIRLMLAERAIAVLIVLRSGDTAWCWKIAYDEQHARASPGVQLILEATKTLLAEPGLAQVDSCAAPDHPMIDHIWRERLPLADRLVQPGPHGGAAFAFTRALEAARTVTIAAARHARDLLRR